MGCDWTGGDLTSALTRGEDCSNKCLQTTGCTHYTWTGFNGGTCWMKSGTVSPSEAKTSSSGNVCGYIGFNTGLVKMFANYLCI